MSTGGAGAVRSTVGAMNVQPYPPPLTQPVGGVDAKGEPSGGGGEQEEEGYLGFSEPWSVDWCFSVIGAEYCHTYFWILKDLAWTQGWRLFSISVGSFAIMWWTILLYHALRLRNIDEIWNCIGLFLWLFANFWWMTGEAHDYAYPDSPSISDRHNDESAHMLEAACIWLSVYYLIVVPTWGQITKDPKAIEEYDDGEFKPRFTYFKNFRQYENIHTLFWLSKDLAWNRNNISMWFVFLWPTVGIAADLLWVSLCGKDTIIDTAHFTSALLWVLGNAVWALGEFFTQEDDTFKLWDFDSKEALTTARWWSSWILIWSIVPVIVLYIFWVPLSYMGRIPVPAPPPPRRVPVRKRRRSTTTSAPRSYQQGTAGGAADVEGDGYGDGNGNGNGNGDGDGDGDGYGDGDGDPLLPQNVGYVYEGGMGRDALERASLMSSPHAIDDF